jgi:N6-L-threonylcarbamoyladenine synthase
MNILGIETSCDETAASIVKAQKGGIDVLSNVISSQIKLHAQWGGVVPNLAAREHLKNILPVVETAISEAGLKPKDIDLLAVTNGPGLIPALLIGTNAAKTLSYLWKKPLLGIHHIEGHIYANFICDKIRAISNFQIPRLDSQRLVDARRAISKQISKTIRRGGQNSKIKFPILCLVVSGGHTQLVLMKNHLNYKIVGQTLDDAAGEAFDKVARILKLGYPGGPAIAACAKKRTIRPESKAELLRRSSLSKAQLLQGSGLSASQLILPRPMINSANLNFSFSGLKTAVLYETKKHPELLKNKKYVSALCAEFQQAVVDVLITKTLKAAEIYKPKTIMLAGGVSANQELRKQLNTRIKKELENITYTIPEIQYSIDNAAMIAAAGAFRWQKMSAKKRINALTVWRNLKTNANLKLK